jgi:hypothetical protein
VKLGERKLISSFKILTAGIFHFPDTAVIPKAVTVCF